jgi:hypothetical protein
MARYKTIPAETLVALVPNAVVMAGARYPITHYQERNRLAQVMVGSTAYIVTLPPGLYPVLPEVELHLGDDDTY